MVSAFQSNAFQNNAFEISSSAATSAVPTFRLIGKKREDQYSYIRNVDVEREEQYLKSIAKKRLELKEVEEKISLAENRQDISKARSKAKLAAKYKAAEQKKLEAQLQEEIGRLRIERIVLMRWIDDQEAILVLLLSSPL